MRKTEDSSGGLAVGASVLIAGIGTARMSGFKRDAGACNVQEFSGIGRTSAGW